MSKKHIALILHILMLSVTLQAEKLQLSWSKTFGSNEFDASESIAIDANQDVYVAGVTYGDMNGSNSGLSDIFLSKFSHAGSLLWTKQYGTPFKEYVEGMIFDNVGNLYIIGSTTGDLDGNHPVVSDEDADNLDAYIIKMTSSGDVIWIKQFHNQNDKYINITDIKIDSSDNIYITGLTEGNTDGTHADTGNLPDIYIAKYTSDGTQIFLKQISTETYVSPHVAINSVNHAMLLYSEYHDGTYQKILLNEYSSDGTLLRHKEFTHDQTDLNSKNITIDDDNNVYIEGLIFPYYVNGEEFGNNTFIEKYNASWEEQWHVDLPAKKYTDLLSVDSNRTLYVAGYTDYNGTVGDNTTSGKADTFLIGIDKNGSIRFAEQYGTAEDDYPAALVIDNKPLANSIS